MSFISEIKDIYNYRTMVKSIINKDLRTRYRGSFLGFLWTFVNPLIQLIIYSIVFPYLLRMQIENYAMFMFVCLIPWIFFSSTVVGSCSLILNNANIVTKIYFPRVILPISFTLSGLVNMLLSYLIVIPMLYFFDIKITFYLLWLIPLFLLLTLLAMGFAMFFSAMNVYFRDIEHVLGVFMLGLYFFTPVLYSLDIFPTEVQHWFYYNPLTSIMLSIRSVAMYGSNPDFNMLIYPIFFTVVMLLIGYTTFNKLQRKFAEMI